MHMGTQKKRPVFAEATSVHLYRTTATCGRASSETRICNDYHEFVGMVEDLAFISQGALHHLRPQR
jgi:hypothetical protein